MVFLLRTPAQCRVQDCAQNVLTFPNGLALCQSASAIALMVEIYPTASRNDAKEKPSSAPRTRCIGAM
jgi:hypothetical protein